MCGYSIRVVTGWIAVALSDFCIYLSVLWLIIQNGARHTFLCEYGFLFANGALWGRPLWALTMWRSFQVHHGRADPNREDLRQRPTGVHGCERRANLRRKHTNTPEKHTHGARTKQPNPHQLNELTTLLNKTHRKSRQIFRGNYDFAIISGSLYIIPLTSLLFTKINQSFETKYNQESLHWFKKHLMQCEMNEKSLFAYTFGNSVHSNVWLFKAAVCTELTDRLMPFWPSRSSIWQSNNTCK